MRVAPLLVLLLVLALGAVAAAQTPFVSEIVESSASDLGRLSALALDLRGNPHISYHDNTLGDIKYARKAGASWLFEVADDGGGSVVSGSGTLVLDPQGDPHLAYQDVTFGDLKYARKAGGFWTREIADGSANNVGNRSVLVLDGQGNPHLVHYDASLLDLLYTRKSGGVWSSEVVDGSVSDVGQAHSLRLNSRGDPQVCYNDVGTGDLKYAWKLNGVWTIETADGTPNDVGYHCSLALDAQEAPHISYRDGTLGDLIYARKVSGVWLIETVDASANNVGINSSLELDAAGNPCISYRDGTLGDLLFARKTAGAWTIETVDGSPNFLALTAPLCVDGHGNPHVSYYDQSATDLRYAHGAVRILSPAAGSTWAVGSLQSVAWSGRGAVEVLLSVDGGRTFDLLSEDVTEGAVAIRVPHAPSRFAKIRLRRASPFSTSDTDSFFTIDATIALAKFEATRGDGGTRLAWETQPGPEAGIRYRVERATNDATFASIADGLDRGEFLDAGAAPACRYRLIAVNGLGAEYALGETGAAPALAADRDIIAYPNPASGPIEIVYRVPFDREMDLEVYDASGRRVRALVASRQPQGVRSVKWDGRDEAGRDVAAGTYFARLTSGAAFTATQRVTIVR